MAAALMGRGVHVVSCCGEDPLPRPLLAGTRVLALQGVRQFHPTRLQMGLQLRGDSCGEHRPAVARALAAPDDDPVAREIEILDSKAAALEQAQAGPVEERGHEAVGSGEAMEQVRHLRPTEHNRETEGSLGAHDVLEQGKSAPSRARYKKRIADRAWFRVDAETCWSTATDVRKGVISPGPSSAECRFPFARISRRAPGPRA